MFRKIAKILLQRTLFQTIATTYSLKSERHFVYTIFLVNFFPIIGAVFFGWNLADAFVFFWVDNLVVGIIHTFKLILTEKGSFAVKVSTAIGFNFIWGFFTLVHGVFTVVFTLLSYASTSTELENFTIEDYNFYIFPIAFISSFLIHFIDFIKNYVLNKEYKLDIGQDIFMQPFLRGLILHLSLILFGFIFMPLLSIGGILIQVLQPFGIIVEIISHISLFLIGLAMTLVLGIIKTYWDFMLIFNADKLTIYTSARQKKKSKELKGIIVVEELEEIEIPDIDEKTQMRIVK